MARVDEVKLVVGGDLLYHETKKVYAAALTSKVMFYPAAGGQARTVSTRISLMTTKEYLELVKEQKDKTAAMNTEIKKILDECPEAKCDVGPFMYLDTSKKPHWRHIRDGSKRHYVVCSMCDKPLCVCEPGKGAPPADNPHGLSKHFRCWLPAYN